MWLQCLIDRLNVFISSYSYDEDVNELYGQCGNAGQDHSVWGREDEYYNAMPEPNPRPCYKIDATKPGSDLAGETAAALTATSLAFKDVNLEYSAKLLEHARQLYTFAKTYKGKYSDSIPDAGNFYNSFSGYYDELAWSAAWLYKATGEEAYLNDAETFYNQMQQDAGEISWDNKGRAVAILLSQLTENSRYKQNADSFCNMFASGNHQKTKRGIVFIQQWGSNRHAANVAFACLSHSKRSAGQFDDFGQNQIDLMLGDEEKGQRSFVVGYGFNPPTQPHHRSSSCPDRPATCNWNNFNSPQPNPQTLFGALVGGPNSVSANYNDKRNDYIQNEVAIDYNAGFQSAIAALLSLQRDNDCDAK